MFASGMISILLNFTSLSTLLFDHQTNNEIFIEGIFPAGNIPSINISLFVWWSKSRVLKDVKFKSIDIIPEANIADISLQALILHQNQRSINIKPVPELA